MAGQVFSPVAGKTAGLIRQNHKAAVVGRTIVKCQNILQCHFGNLIKSFSSKKALMAGNQHIVKGLQSLKYIVLNNFAGMIAEKQF